MTISVIVLTRNEEKNIENCLERLAWADEVLVVDSESTDGTVALATQKGARVVTHPFTDFASQRNFAITEAKGDWLLFVDADERVPLYLADEIKQTAQDAECVYAIPRQNYFFGKRLRFGDAGNDAPVRLFPRQHATWAQPVHEKVSSSLPVRALKNPLLHYSTRDLAHYLQKVRDYVPFEIEIMTERGVRPSLLSVFFAPPAKFLWLYVLKFGFLDGVAGFQYAILSAYYALRKQWLYFRKRV